MVPQNLNFWSISRKESLRSQHKHAIKITFLRAIFYSNDNFNPGYNRKMLFRKRTSILDEVFLIMNSCFIHYNAPLEKYVNVALEIESFRKKLFVFCHFYFHFRIFQIYVVSVAVYDNDQLVCICVVYTYSSLTGVYCPF